MNMFTDTVTVYMSTSNGYKRKIVSGVKWYGSYTLSMQDRTQKGIETISVVFPKEALADYTDEYAEDKFYLHKGDRIVKGAQTLDITMWRDLNVFSEVITIGFISDNRCGSRIDNIEVRSA